MLALINVDEVRDKGLGWLKRTIDDLIDRRYPIVGFGTQPDAIATARPVFTRYYALAAGTPVPPEGTGDPDDPGLPKYPRTPVKKTPPRPGRGRR